MRELLVLGKSVKISYVSKSELKAHGEDLWGVYLPEGPEILIYKHLAVKRRLEVLRHEVMHAMLDISGLSTILNEKEEEAICNLVENFPTL